MFGGDNIGKTKEQDDHQIITIEVLAYYFNLPHLLRDFYKLLFDLAHFFASYIKELKLLLLYQTIKSSFIIPWEEDNGDIVNRSKSSPI